MFLWCLMKTKMLKPNDERKIYEGIILLINFLFIAAISSLCSLFAEVPNEADSAQYICEISMADSTYYLHDEKVGTLYRSADKRNAFIGTYEDGLFFDGENAYQYKNNQKTPITEFPFEQYDSYASEILNTCQTIISKKLYTAYNDERSYYKEHSYYFKISKEGLALFRDRTYEYGLISCFYPDKTFQEFSLDLYEDKEARPSLVCTFGTIDYTTSILPATISAVENRPHAEFAESSNRSCYRSIKENAITKDSPRQPFAPFRYRAYHH